MSPNKANSPPMIPAWSQDQSAKCDASVTQRDIRYARMRYLTFSPLALKISGSSVVLQTCCKRVVLPAFDLPRTRILKWPMRSKCFLTSAGSSLMSATMLYIQANLVTQSSYYSLLASSESEARCPEFLKGRADRNLLKCPGVILAVIWLLCNENKSNGVVIRGQVVRPTLISGLSQGKGNCCMML